MPSTLRIQTCHDDQHQDMSLSSKENEDILCVSRKEKVYNLQGKKLDYYTS